VYLVGEVVGAPVFGRLSDALGRRKLFMVTLGIYLVGSGLTAATAGSGPGWVAFLYATRFVSGMGRPGIRGRLPSGRPASQTAEAPGADDQSLWLLRDGRGMSPCATSRS
jgi:MFS family permease